MRRRSRRSTSKYRVCIIRQDGAPVSYIPGSEEEYDLIESVCERVLMNMPYKVHVDDILSRLEKRGVGMFRSQAKVLEAVKEEILKSEAENNVDFKDTLEKAFEDVFYLVKSEVQP